MKTAKLVISALHFCLPTAIVALLSTSPLSALTPTTITLSVSPATVYWCQPQTFTASVPFGVLGTVTFFVPTVYPGGFEVPLSGNQAQLTVPCMGVGTNTVTATYSGGVSFAPSNSNPVTVQVYSARTSLTLSSPSFGQLLSPGQLISITALVTVLPPSQDTPAGSIQILDNGVVIASTRTLFAAGLFSSNATFGVNGLAPGTHQISAQYTQFGDTSPAALFAPSSSPVYSVTIRQSPSVTITASANPVVWAQDVTLTATVSPPGVTGSVVFSLSPAGAGSPPYYGGLGPPVPLSGNLAQLVLMHAAAMSIGSHDIFAVYTGDSIYGVSVSAPIALQVTAVATSTTITQPATNASWVAGQAPKIRANVHVLPPAYSAGVGGNIVFFDNGSALSLPLTQVEGDQNGDLAFTAPLDILAAGPHILTARYTSNKNPPDGTPSTSPPISVTVKRLSPLNLTISTSTIRWKQSATLTAQLQFGGTGSVTFVDPVDFPNGIQATLSAAQAQLTYSNFSVGKHTITANYAGDTNNGGAQSQSVTLVVNPANTTTTLTAPTGTDVLLAGQTVNLAARVDGEVAGIAPSGWIQFVDGATAITLAPLSNGVATAQYAGLTLGPHSFLANYVPGPDAQGNTDWASSASSSAAFNVTGAQSSQFVPITPCRAVDTRNSPGPLGGPAIPGGAFRSFALPDSPCGIPNSAIAYVLVVTAVPNTKLGYLTVWPAGQAPPLVSTLNSYGPPKANAAIVPAGVSGAISIFVTDTTDVVLDVSGYFTAAPTSASLAFYPLAPCRIVDTRGSSGPLAGPYLAGGVARTFPVQQSPCNVPASSKAYSLNLTAVPMHPLGYLTAWPSGTPQPSTTSLTAITGSATATAAIVAAGQGGNIDVYASNDTDLIVDVNGYFAPAGTGGLAYYLSAPCRVIDTRLVPGSSPLSTFLDVPVSGGPCQTPNSAQAFVLNITLVPAGSVGYLTIWPRGQTRPLASSINAFDGAITSNLAVVPTLDGAVTIYPSDPTDVILDISGYFAP